MKTDEEFATMDDLSGSQTLVKDEYRLKKLQEDISHIIDETTMLSNCLIAVRKAAEVLTDRINAEILCSENNKFCYKRPYDAKDVDIPNGGADKDACSKWMYGTKEEDKEDCK